jgi:hypothetical protein
METLTFPRWKGEHTRRAAHAPRRRALRGLQEAHAAGCLPRRRSARCRAGERCQSAVTGARHAISDVGRRCMGHEGNAISPLRGRRTGNGSAATCHESEAYARTQEASVDDGDSGASRRSARRREQRRRNGSRHQTSVSFEHGCRMRDVGLRVELVPFYRHALPMRTARPDAA